MKQKLGVLVIVAALLIGSAGLAAAQSIQVRTTPAGVRYLTDESGLTLYWFTRDKVNTSACLNAADFSTITRTDGGSLATYRGYPLYYWAK